VNKKISVMLILSLAVIFSVGMFLLVPNVNAEDENYPDFIEIENDQVCPAVCVPMWEIQNNTCVFDECGSGCGPNRITTFETREECLKALTQNKTQDIEFRIKMIPQANGKMFDKSTIYLDVISKEALTDNNYKLVASLKEANVDTADPISNVLLLEIKDIYDIRTEKEIVIISENADVYNKIKIQESQPNSNIKRQMVVSNEARNNLFRYSYVISFEENKDNIVKFFGKDYKDKEYVLELKLMKVLVKEGEDPILHKKSLNFTYQTDNSLTPPLDRVIDNSRIRISQGNLDVDEKKYAEIIKRRQKAQDRVIEISSMKDYDVFTDENFSEMYVSDKARTIKLKAFENVLKTNNIEKEKVVGNIEVVSIDNNPEYAFKLRERRLLLGFIPFGHREKFVSLDATDEVILAEE
jgi:hypothetical protein